MRIGVDGGGTWTRVVVADEHGRELVRERGPATLVDPADPEAAVETLAELVRGAVSEAGAELPVAGLCAGLAGTGDPGVRKRVAAMLGEQRLARTLEVVTDGEVALDAALGADPGIVLVAGTGSVAYGRSERGEIGRCGGWGLVLGDEGSGYAIARAGLHALLRAADGRGGPTRLLPELLEALELERPEQVPAWTGRSDKAEIAGLAPLVVEIGEAGDLVASRIVAGAAIDLGRHVDALIERLSPWSEPVRVVFMGTVLAQGGLARRVEERLQAAPHPAVRVDPLTDAVTAAVRRASRL